MKRILSIAFTLAFFSNNIFGGDTLQWKSGNRLTWNDFNGKAGRSPSGTGSYLGFEYDLSNDATSFKAPVTTFFLRDLSWSQFKDNNNLLEHEQIRFDLTELYARKLRKAFSEYKFSNEVSVAGDLKSLFRQVKAEHTEANEKYNKETKYGTDLKAQTEWANKVAADLDRLGAFAL